MTHLVAPVMGTTVTIDIRDPGIGPDTVAWTWKVPQGSSTAVPA